MWSVIEFLSPFAIILMIALIIIFSFNAFSATARRKDDRMANHFFGNAKPFNTCTIPNCRGNCCK